MKSFKTFSSQDDCRQFYEQHAKDAKKVETNEQISENDQRIQCSLLYENLSESLERLRAFISNLGKRKDHPISPEMISTLEIGKQIYENINSHMIMNEAEKRIVKMVKTNKIKRNWSICDLRILIWVVCRLCERDGVDPNELHNSQENWEFVSSLIPGTTRESCLFKWLSLKRHKISQHNWSPNEEKWLAILEEKYSKEKNKWKFISQELYLLNQDDDKIFRLPKQCRQHYTSFLDPQIKKGPWALEEDVELLRNIYQSSGEKKWCRLCKMLEGRTENAIKNRYQLLFLKLRRLKENKNRSEMQIIEAFLKENDKFVKIKQNRRDAAVKNQKIDFGTSNFELQRLYQSRHPIIPIFDFHSQRVANPHLQANMGFTGMYPQNATDPFIKIEEKEQYEFRSHEPYKY